MAGITHTYLHTIKNNAGASVIADKIVITADTEENFSIAVPATSFVEVVMAFNKDDLVSFFVELDQAGVFDTNAHGGAGGNTFPLAANVAFWWNNTLQNANPITVNVTSIFISNSSAVAATAKGGFLIQQ
jgi:hypothetical protein